MRCRSVLGRVGSVQTQPVAQASSCVGCCGRLDRGLFLQKDLHSRLHQLSIEEGHNPGTSSSTAQHRDFAVPTRWTTSSPTLLGSLRGLIRHGQTRKAVVHLRTQNTPTPIPKEKPGMPTNSSLGGLTRPIRNHGCHLRQHRMNVLSFFIPLQRGTMHLSFILPHSIHHPKQIPKVLAPTPYTPLIHPSTTPLTSHFASF
jgi:hypothetical protein